MIDAKVRGILGYPYMLIFYVCDARHMICSKASDQSEEAGGS